LKFAAYYDEPTYSLHVREIMGLASEKVFEQAGPGITKIEFRGTQFVALRDSHGIEKIIDI